MTIEPPRLAIHVFGAGKGESIVLRLPSGGWGVVDCFAGSPRNPSSNPVLAFLRDEGVAELEFLCLTHPHDDHYSGMGHLLEEFAVRYFWAVAGLSGRHFLQLVEYLRFDALQTDLSEEIESATEFQRIFGLVRKKQEHQEPPLRQKVPSPAAQLYPVPFDPSASFRIIGLAPSGNQISHYNEGLIRCFNEKGEVARRLRHDDHNIISSALLVVFGQTRIVLGGDVRREGWLDALHEMGSDELAAAAVKVSHHGSTNGYCEGLWSIFASRGNPIGVVTAYAPQRLPRRQALKEIVSNTSRLFMTCITALKEEELQGVLDVGVLRSRLALMRKMGDLSSEVRHECGRCSLVFDDQGNCIDVKLIPPADQV